MRSTTIILILLIILLSIETTSAEDIEWASESEYTLYEGDRFSKEGYKVEASAFYVDPGLVLITIYQNEEVVASDIITGNEWINYNDEINVTVVNTTGYNRIWINEKDKPRAEIEVRFRAVPELQLTISINKEVYEPDDQIIQTEVVVKNTGTWSIKDVELNIQTDGLQTSKNLKFNYDNIAKRRSEKIEFYLKIPNLKEQRTYNITSTVFGKSWDGERITANTSRSITILPGWKILEIQKKVTESVYLHGDYIKNHDIVYNNYTNNSNISTNSTALVTLEISNPGITDIKGIVLTDYLPENFVLDDDSSLDWEFNLSSKKKKEFSYSMKPLSHGIYTIPDAVANWSLDGKQYDATSILNQSQIIVHAACINLTKSTDQTYISPGDEVTVSVNIKNTGTIQATVNVSDIIPENAILSNNSITRLKRVFLQEGGSQRLVYRIKINSTQDMLLPSASANFSDIYGYSGTTASNTITIYVNEAYNTVNETNNTENATQAIANQTEVSTSGIFSMVIEFISNLFSNESVSE
ncbi:MAG: hypothetical protein K8R25_18255 [Methanosarcinales archaeon]|nr:hypothetical protein [Methanosarcinales archaeon]